MFELLFLLVFTAVLVFTGISVIGILVAVAAGFALMMVAGMLGLVIKLLPWIIVIAIGVYFYREHKESRLVVITITAAVTSCRSERCHSWV